MNENGEEERVVDPETGAEMEVVYEDGSTKETLPRHLKELSGAEAEERDRKRGRHSVVNMVAA